MKNVCIVQGGPFLLGIDCDNVIARRTWIETSAQAKQEDTFFHLAALLSKQAAQAVPDEAVCLELRNGEERVVLVADRIAADEVGMSNPPAPLPSACPALTAKLCPQVIIWEELPVLLLEPTQLAVTAAELGENIGLLLPAEESADAQAAVPEEEDDPFFPEIEEDEAEDDAPSEPTPTMPFFLENALAESAATAQEEEPEPPPVQDAPNKESTAIDEETFKQVMSWTIARFKQQRGKKEEMRLGVEQLPSALAGMIKRKGLNENVIEYLMEQIVLRCKETMSRKKAGGQ